MRALVLAESSGTVNSDAETAVDYYQGNFLAVSQLIGGIKPYCDVETRIVTDSNGLISGSSNVSEEPEQSNEDALEAATSLLIESGSDFHVVVILFTTDVFREVVAEHWDNIIEDVNEDAIWCLGTSRSGISDCDIDILKEDIRELFIYERVGVAPIDSDTRESLLASVESRAKELQ
ncbi:MAG: hypothetical protein ABEH77_05690 [Halobacteriaceae archaeon]